MTYNEVFSFEHLYKSYLKCIRGVRWKSETQRFIGNDIVLINKLYRELQNKTYKADKFKEFDIMERGKPRHISAHSLKDRIVQRCLCDYFLTEALSKQLIYDCGATLKNKGILFSQKRVDTHLHKYYRHYGSKGYCLILDIHHYFDNISHSILKKMIRNKTEDDDLFNLVCYLIDLFPGNYGLGLGSQISQICALSYLNEVDHYIKEKLHIKYYGRYMDDLYIIHSDRQYLIYCLKKISLLLSTLGLELNKKTKIHKLSNGFIFTKIKYILTDSGKILHLITTKTFKSMKRKIKNGVDINKVIPSWFAYLSKFNCHNKLIKFMSKFKIGDI